MSRLAMASVQAGGASQLCQLCLPHLPTACRALVPRSCLASRCLSSMEHGAKSLNSHQTAPAWSQLVEFLLTLPHTCDQAHMELFPTECSRPAWLLPRSWAVSLSMTTGIWSLMSCAPQHPPLPPKLFSLSHQTSPPSTPRDHEETLTGPRAECWDTGTLLTHPGVCHCCHLT